MAAQTVDQRDGTSGADGEYTNPNMKRQAAPAAAPASASGGTVLQAGSTAPQNPNGTPIDTNTSGLSAGITGQQVAGYAPVTQQQEGGIATVDPTTYSATDVNTATLPGALQQSESLNAQALAPQFAAQQVGLDDNLASRGIVNSGAATYENQQLAGQQDAALAGVDAPLISQFAGYQQQDQIANAGAANAAGQFNAGASNTAAEGNAAAYDTETAGNTQSYNQYQNGLLGDASGYGDTLLNSFLGTYGNINSTAESGLNEGTSAAGNAYNNAYNSGGNTGLGTAFSNALSGIGSNGSNSNSNSNNSGTYDDYMADATAYGNGDPNAG